DFSRNALTGALSIQGTQVGSNNIALAPTSGSVGIGTTTPSAKLNVISDNLYNDGSGFVVASSTSNANTVYVSTSSSGNYGAIQSWKNGTGVEPLLLNALGGNVGIGTTNPNEKLHVQGGGIQSEINGAGGTLGYLSVAGKNTSASAPYASRWTMYNMREYGGISGFSIWEYYDANNDGAFCNDAGACSARFTIAPGGNVGIGTTGPSTPLHILNSAGTTATIENQGAGTVTAIAFRQGNPSAQVGSITMTGGSSTAYNTTSDYRTKENFALASYGLRDLLRLPVREYSYKSDPDHRRITGFIAQELYQVFPDAVTTNGDNGLEPLSGRHPWSVDYGKVTPLLANSLKQFAKIVDVSTADFEKTTIKINSEGNVGIGTASPGFTLDVNGSIASVGALQAHSDKRLKKNIVNVDHSLDKLLALNGVYFDWRKDEFPQMHFEGERQMGVIAQDVEKVFPEAVAKNKEGIRSVAYTMLIAPMIEAFKELNKRVTELFTASEGHSRDIASVKAEAIQANDRATKLEAENARKDKEIAKLKGMAQKAEQENAAIKAYLCSRDPKASICK
ncbi:MAG: tail fiber domain-containing protein, partial [Bacteriovorax sp.]